MTFDIASRRRHRQPATVLLTWLAAGAQALAQTDPLPSWTDGAAKRAIMSFCEGDDNAKREYVYSPARGLSDTEVGAFTQALYDEALKKNWVVISMASDWKRIFAFEP